MIEKIKEELILEEYDYCFDVSNITQSDWEKKYGSESREKVYARTRQDIINADLTKLKKMYGNDLIDSIKKDIESE